MTQASRWALVHGGDDSLPELLADVLAELGYVPCDTGALHAELVLVHVDGPSGLAHLEWAARRRAVPGKVVALLPFADDGLRAAALAHGAHGVFALGTPLSQLREVVMEDAASVVARGSRQS